VRQAAASALGQIGDTRAVGVLIGRLSADNPNIRAEALEALSLTCKDQTDRKLLSRDLDAMAPFLDLQQEIDVMRVRQASEELEVPAQEVYCRYEALAQQFPLKLAWQTKRNGALMG
jgi:HEAT repeat protein